MADAEGSAGEQSESGIHPDRTRAADPSITQERHTATRDLSNA
jgi:hypothetical protein